MQGRTMVNCLEAFMKGKYELLIVHQYFLNKRVTFFIYKI